jgi:hypothetical protein
MLGAEHPETLATMSSLSVRLADAGQHVAAEHMALASQHHVLGPDHPHTLRSVSILNGLLEPLRQREGLSIAHARTSGAAARART